MYLLIRFVYISILDDVVEVDQIDTEFQAYHNAVQLHVNYGLEFVVSA
jgi:hypothetical protein